MQSSRRRILVAVGVGLLLVSGVAAALFVGASGPSPTSGPAPEPFTAATADALAAHLRSGDATQVAMAVELPGNMTLAPDVVRQFQQMPALQMDASSYRDHGDGTAEVLASTADDKRWTVYLALDHGLWKITAAVPA